MCDADAASYCQSMPFVPGGDGCPLPACSVLPSTRHTVLSFVPPRSLQHLNHPDYISSRFLIISYQPTSICLCSSATRGGIPTARPSPGSLRGVDTSLWRCWPISPNQNISFQSPLHQLVDIMCLMKFLPEPPRKCLLGTYREIPCCRRRSREGSCRAWMYEKEVPWSQKIRCPLQVASRLCASEALHKDTGLGGTVLTCV